MRISKNVPSALCGLIATVTVAAAAPAIASPANRVSGTAAERAAAALPAPRAIAWHACADSSLRSAKAVCGYLSVPLDWNRPRGPKIRIAVSKVAHTVSAAKYQGVMLVNPGGPGGSGLGLATLGSFVPHHAGDSYDWIGFDPRGVGSSKPSLSCIPNYFKGPRPQYVPTSKRLERIWLRRSKAYATACAKKHPGLIRHMTTKDVARDMDYLRVALHRKQINYYGFSYGTYLGEVYSTLFPSHVRRMVFDATVDPRRVWYRANLDQDIAFEKTEGIWFGWLARYNRVYHLGATAADVRATFVKQRRMLARKPAGGVVGGDEWVDIFLNAGYYQLVWVELGNLFATWVHHGPRAVPKLVQAYKDYVGPTDDNGFAVYNAVQCTDTAWPRKWSTWRLDNWRTYAKAPFETWANAWYNAPCLYWKAAPHKPVTIDGRRVRSLLMIDETLDAATPYPGSIEVRRRYPGARLIAEPGGTTHAGSLYGNACVDNKIAVYLATGALPHRRSGNHADVFCKPLPQPSPTSSALQPQLRTTVAVRPLVGPATVRRG